MIDSDGGRCNAGRAGNGSQWQGRIAMAGKDSDGTGGGTEKMCTLHAGVVL